MSSTIALPFQTIRDDLCALGRWQRYDRDDEPEPVEADIPGWDYDFHLDFGRSVALQPRAISEQLGLTQHDPELLLTVIAETGPTGYRWTAYRVAIPGSLHWEHEIRFAVDSSRLAERLSLSTEILLMTDIRNASPFTADRVGSRLYRETCSIQLEGSLGRFPMEMIDFQKSLPFLGSPEALWYLDWDPLRPESQFLGTVLLYINSANDQTSRLVQSAESAILTVLRCDVIRNMCETMLHNDDFLSEYHDYEAGTVGAQVRDWLTLAFGDERPQLLRTKLDNSPSRFDARLQSAFS